MRVPVSGGVFAVLCGAMIVPAVVAGQSIPSAYEFVDTRQEVGIFAGTANLSTGRFGFGPSGGSLLGARWGINLSGPLAFDLVAAGLSGERDVVDPARAEGQRIVGQADVLMGMVDARLVFTLTGDRTWHGIAPFIQAGGGMTFDLAGSDPADESVLPSDRFELGTSFLGTFGAGSRLFITRRLVLRGDANFSLYKIDTPPGFSDPERGFTAVEESQWANGITLTLAAAIRF